MGRILANDQEIQRGLSHWDKQALRSVEGHRVWEVRLQVISFTDAHTGQHTFCVCTANADHLEDVNKYHVTVCRLIYRDLAALLS